MYVTLKGVRKILAVVLKFCTKKCEVPADAPQFDSQCSARQHGADADSDDILFTTQSAPRR